jgi:hypothetical protein
LGGPVVEQMADWPGEAIELANHDGIEALTVCVGHKAIKLRARLLCAADADVFDRRARILRCGRVPHPCVFQGCGF